MFELPSSSIREKVNLEHRCAGDPSSRRVNPTVSGCLRIRRQNPSIFEALWKTFSTVH